jgi:Metallo-peptidase family M12B Reprolysin-like/Ig-like domain CHU_C associated/Secretion system C-terminal sorting domain
MCMIDSRILRIKSSLMKTVFPFKWALLSVALFLIFNVKAQQQKSIQYSPIEIFSNDLGTFNSSQITAESYKLYQIDIEVLRSQLIGIAQREDTSKGFTALISFPHPDGSIHEYQALGNRTLSAELGAKFPEIKTYDAVDTEGRKVKWDITDKGLHVMIFQPDESTIFIDPVVDGNNQYYIVYYKKDFRTDKIMSCDFNSDASNLNPEKNPISGANKTFGSCELRTYRLALAATGEYTAFHGGTVADAQAAQAVSMNRVNGVYERDMAITMIIIPNNDLIIYTNGGSDPYTNGSPFTMINQNQSNIDGVIGNGNYDIGHVFGTNSGGLAGLGVVCNNSNKARGVTGSAAPIGDPFDIDYVAHETGHQFGANHTQNNNCNRNNATAVEPGSASTIMGYAGICVPNVQSNSDDHFHGINMEEIGFEIMSAGHTCEVITPLANSAPLITATNGNITIPANTPFALSASVSDVDGDAILYCWEQIDPAVSTQAPLPTNTVGPNFRSNSPIPDSTRYFPNLPDLVAGISPTWEVIPSVSRTMNFRITVRDQTLNVPGCHDNTDVTVTFDAGSGPFLVLYPSITGIVWTALTSETVTWDVANTDLAPVNCANVDILLSTDGGLSYPFTLATGVPNDGSEVISVPSIATTTARIMVINSNGTFFDISDNDFEIDVPIVCNAPDVPTVSGVTTICDGQTATLSVTAGNLNDAADWQWYETSCGGTSVGSGVSIAVSPNNTTTYFVRGEGGCVTAGVCTQVVEVVNPVYNLNENASICQGQSYIYPDGSSGTVSESYTSSLTTLLGCDSIIITALTVTASYNVNESASICNGNTYTFPDATTGTTTQTYTSSLLTTAGCDSIIITDLTVVNTYNMNESANICNGATYTFPDGTTGTTSQNYTSTLVSTGGCDSIIVTALTVNSASNQNVNATICDGDIYTFPDATTAMTAQTQTSVLTDGNGCDSTIITTLSVTSVDVSVTVTGITLQANLAGATYQWIDCGNGNSPIAGATNQSYTSAAGVGNYAVIITQGGCSDTSACYMIDQTGVEELATFDVKMYPNPTSELVNLNWDGKVFKIEVTDARGRILSVTDTQAMSSLVLDFSSYSKGLYFVHLITEHGRIVKDLVKQ